MRVSPTGFSAAWACPSSCRFRGRSPSASDERARCTSGISITSAPTARARALDLGARFMLDGFIASSAGGTSPGYFDLRAVDVLAPLPRGLTPSRSPRGPRQAAPDDQHRSVASLVPYALLYAGTESTKCAPFPGGV